MKRLLKESDEVKEKKKYQVCFKCGKKISKDEATPIYKEILNRETGELKQTFTAKATIFRITWNNSISNPSLKLNNTA